MSNKPLKNKPGIKAAKPPALPISGGRSSKPSGHNPQGIITGLAEYRKLPPAWYLPIIPIIRKLVQINPDIGQALNNVVTLSNTGHKIYFDPAVTPEMQDKMRRHLEFKQKEWGVFLPGMHGIVNRTGAQALISGAISCEWVPNKNLTSIEAVLLPNPEEIRFKLRPDKLGYEAFQAPQSETNTNVLAIDKWVKLNPYTYRYLAINGDGETPYGFPPYLSALRGIKTQTNMLDNIDFVIEQLGIMGFTSVMVEKPDIQDDETPEKYQSRLEGYLNSAKARVKEGFKDGAIVGFKDAHEVDFNSISRDFNGVTKLFENNELMVASGVKTDASLLGRGYSTSESQITIVFTKLLSELKNLQIAQKTNLEFGYSLELRLAGFNFDYLTVEFNRSTLQDELKFQQGQEIKQRVLKELRIDGIIGQDQYADEMGYKQAFSPEPIVPFDQQMGKPDPAAEAKKLDKKNKSERGTTDKKNPQGTVRKQTKK